MLQSYQPLIRFWAAVFLLSGAGAATLQALGPPPLGGGEAKTAAAPPGPAVPPAPQAEAAAPTPAAGPLPPAAEPVPVVARAVPPVAPPIVAPPAGDAAGEAAPVPPAASLAPRKPSPVRRAAPPGDGAGTRYGADRRLPTRDIWGNPLSPAYYDWADRAYPGGRGAGGYIGTYAVGPDGTRSFRVGP